MNDTVLIIIAAIALLIIVAGLLMYVGSRRRDAGLHNRFGPEYDRTVGAADSRRAQHDAREDLAARAEIRDRLDIRPLSEHARERYAQRWRDTQTQFVDAPQQALQHAEILLDEVMSERGYPIEGFESQVALISVDHPQLVENYRAAHAINAQGEQPATTTDDRRDAFLRYRSLFEELLAPDSTAA